MTQTITQAFVQQWDTSIRHLAQQTESRLQSRVTDRGSITGESFTSNKLAALGLLDEKVQRLGDTTWSELAHSTRVAVMRDFYQALPLDRADIPKMIVNPVTGGDYAKALMAARNRRIDQIIFASMLGTVTLKDGSTVSLPAGQKILHGSTGFTKAKIIQAKKLFRKNEADEFNGEQLYCAYNSEMLEDILTDTQLTSADFMAVRMLQEGGVGGKWMGIEWVPYEAIQLVTTTYTTVMWAKSAMHFGRGYEEGNVTRRGDKQDAWQVSMAASYGAVRNDEEKLVSIEFQ